MNIRKIIALVLISALGIYLLLSLQLFYAPVIRSNFNYLPRLKAYLTSIALSNYGNYSQISEEYSIDSISQQLTRIIHQSWKNHTLPPRFVIWSNSWKSCFPDWQYKLWSDADNRELIAKHYSWFLKTYDNYPHVINRADAVRYFYMYHYGGIYSDLDGECQKPFEHLLVNHSIVLGAMAGQYGGIRIPEGYTQNSFMYSQPHEPFWMELIKSLLEVAKSVSPNHKGNPNGAEGLTGPIILMQALVKYRVRFPERIMIYPPSYFNPYSWIQYRGKKCATLNRMTMDQVAICRTEFNTSYVIQYHSQTWRHGKIL